MLAAALVLPYTLVSVYSFVEEGNTGLNQEFGWAGEMKRISKVDNILWPTNWFNQKLFS